MLVRIMKLEMKLLKRVEFSIGTDGNKTNESENYWLHQWFDHSLQIEKPIPEILTCNYLTNYYDKHITRNHIIITSNDSFSFAFQPLKCVHRRC